MSFANAPKKRKIIANLKEKYTEMIECQCQTKAIRNLGNILKNIPRAISLAVLIYVVISIGTLFAIPTEEIIKSKEYALAAGAGNILGNLGTNLVILGAILATSSAISGTVFGSSRQMSVIAKDGYFPNWLSIRKNNIPQSAIIGMAVMASVLILIGGLEFGSITFLLVSLLMAVANYRIRDKTNSSKFLTALSIFGLGIGHKRKDSQFKPSSFLGKGHNLKII